MEIGEKIRKLRTVANMMQDELAAKLLVVMMGFVGVAGSMN